MSPLIAEDIGFGESFVDPSTHNHPLSQNRPRKTAAEQQEMWHPGQARPLGHARPARSRQTAPACAPARTSRNHGAPGSPLTPRRPFRQLL